MSPKYVLPWSIMRPILIYYTVLIIYYKQIDRGSDKGRKGLRSTHDLCISELRFFSKKKVWAYCSGLFGYRRSLVATMYLQNMDKIHSKQVSVVHHHFVTLMEAMKGGGGREHESSFHFWRKLPVHLPPATQEALPHLLSELVIIFSLICKQNIWTNVWGHTKARAGAVYTYMFQL